MAAQGGAARGLATRRHGRIRGAGRSTRITEEASPSGSGQSGVTLEDVLKITASLAGSVDKLVASLKKDH